MNLIYSKKQTLVVYDIGELPPMESRLKYITYKATQSCLQSRPAAKQNNAVFTSQIHQLLAWCLFFLIPGTLALCMSDACLARRVQCLGLWSLCLYLFFLLIFG